MAYDTPLPLPCPDLPYGMPLRPVSPDSLIHAEVKAFKMMVLILGVQLVSLLPYISVVTARYLREEYVSSDVKKVWSVLFLLLQVQFDRCKSRKLSLAIDGVNSRTCKGQSFFTLQDEHAFE